MHCSLSKLQRARAIIKRIVDFMGSKKLEKLRRQLNSRANVLLLISVHLFLDTVLILHSTA